MVWLLLLGQAVDIVTTVVAMTLFHCHEGNPLLAWMSLPTLVLTKVGVVGMAAVLVSRYPQHPLSPATAYGGAFVGFAAGLWNLLVVVSGLCR